MFQRRIRLVTRWTIVVSAEYISSSCNHIQIRHPIPWCRLHPAAVYGGRWTSPQHYPTQPLPSTDCRESISIAFSLCEHSVLWNWGSQKVGCLDKTEFFSCKQADQGVRQQASACGRARRKPGIHFSLSQQLDHKCITNSSVHRKRNVLSRASEGFREQI